MTADFENAPNAYMSFDIRLFYDIPCVKNQNAQMFIKQLETYRLTHLEKRPADFLRRPVQTKQFVVDPAYLKTVFPFIR